MDTISSYHSQPIGFKLEYDSRLRFYFENAHGAKIYKDCIHRFVVKAEDHPFEFDQNTWVNFQGDRYMGRDGSMYILIEEYED